MMRLMLIDTFALIHRSYHALPRLTTPQGEPIGAVYGFSRLFLKAIREFKPDYVAAAFDLPQPTFRHQLYKNYQATRPKVAEELSSQIPKVKILLDAFGVPVLSSPGFEADDVIGSIVEKYKDKPNLEVIIITGDLDTLQLVGDKVKVYTLKKGVTETIIYDEKAVRDRFGFLPKFIPDYKGLVGDASDNIPGVPGIGPKTAGALIGRFGSLENIFKSLERKTDTKAINPRLVEMLAANKSKALFSKDLATIRRDLPLEVNLSKEDWVQIQSAQGVTELFRTWGFKTLITQGRQPDIKTIPADSSKKAIGLTLKWQKEIRLSSEESWLLALAEAEKRQELFIALALQDNRCNARPKILALAIDGLFFWWQEDFIFPEAAQKLFFSKHIKKITHDGKRLIHGLRNLGAEAGGEIFSTQVAGWLLQSDLKINTIGELARFFLKKDFGTQLGILTPSLETIKWELGLLIGLYRALSSGLEENKLASILENIEAPLTRVLVEMERNGVFVDSNILRKVDQALEIELAKVEKNIFTAAGETFQIASSKQLIHILFEKLKLPQKGIRKTPGGAISTDSSQLEKLARLDPIVSQVLTWRELAKIKTTYVESLVDLIDPDTGRLHATFNQTGTATGRLASESPNLQNIPKQGRWAKEVRQAFGASPGNSLISFDYSQIELRIAASVSRDPKMIEAFKTGQDIHALTAATIRDIPINQVTPQMRAQAKALNFGILYGMGERAFSQTAKINLSQARQFIKEYFRDFSRLAQYLEETKEFARKNGYVETPTGRRRYLPGIASPFPQERSAAERMATNMPIQGFAADIMKMAMIKIYDDVLAASPEVKLILQVHDELLFEVKDEIIKDVNAKIKDIMENIWKLEVPLKVSSMVGSNWGELKPIS